MHITRVQMRSTDPVGYAPFDMMHISPRGLCRVCSSDTLITCACANTCLERKPHLLVWYLRGLAFPNHVLHMQTAVT